jgi:DNA-binding SARP family transcriptional activator
MHPNTTNKDHYTATTPQASPEAPQALRVWLLDGFRVSVGLRTIEEGAWRRRKAAALVKLLALAPGHRLHREQVIALLWPDLGRRAAANNLRQALYAARKIIDSDQVAASRYLALQGEQIVLCP